MDAVITVWQRPEILAYVAASGPDFLGLQQLDLAWVHKLNGDETQKNKWLKEGIGALTKTDVVLTPVDRADQLTTLAQLLALQGDFDGAVNAAREAIAIFSKSNDQWDAPTVYLRAWHAMAMAGERDEALENIRQLIDMPSKFSRWQLYLDPRWDFFRDDERFNELIRPANLDETNRIRTPVGR